MTMPTTKMETLFDPDDAIYKAVEVSASNFETLTSLIDQVVQSFIDLHCEEHDMKELHLDERAGHGPFWVAKDHTCMITRNSNFSTFYSGFSYVNMVGEYARHTEYTIWSTASNRVADHVESLFDVE